MEREDREEKRDLLENREPLELEVDLVTRDLLEQLG